MYHAVDDVLPRLDELQLYDRLVPPEQAKTLEDAKLVMYVRDHGRLHPKIVGQRKISRTDIFEVLFGPDDDAKRTAHFAFDSAYQKYVGHVVPLAKDARKQLERLASLDIRLGVITNRKRAFMTHELSQVDDGGWHDLFETLSCGNDVTHRKPAPDLIHHALAQLNAPADSHCWYMGDSTTDIIAARRAGVTAIFYNGAQWDQAWLDKIFPGTATHPHQPDTVVDSLSQLVELARLMIANDKRVSRAQKE